MNFRDTIELLILCAIAYHIVDQALARLFIWRTKRAQARALAAEREARIATLLAETHKADGFSMTGQPSRLGDYYVEVPRGVEPWPLIKFTICMLRAQDRRRFFAQGNPEDLDS
jgi:hypothetical protein